MNREQIEARLSLFAKAGKRSSTLYNVEIKDFFCLKFKTITAIKSAFKKNSTIEAINAIFDEQGKTFKQKQHADEIKFLFFIVDNIKIITDVEKESFGNTYSDVDTSDLIQFGDFNIVDKIVKTYNCYTHEQVENMQYIEVFTIMKKIHVEQNIERMLYEKQNRS